jgi:phosphate-selective porin OprO/OprP
MHEMSFRASVVVLCLGGVAQVHAQTVEVSALQSVDSRRNQPVSSAPAQSASQEEPSIYDRIWKFAEWYDDPSNRIVQRVLFSGRFQYEFASVRADQGDVNEWNVRRLRLGPRVTLFRTFTLHVEAELNPQEHDPLYSRLTDAYLAWSDNPGFVLTFGKQGVPFTLEGSTSSKELITIDRSNLANNIWFPEEYMTGVSVSGRRSPWTYRAGVYSAGAENREFGEFTGSLFTLGVLGYDFRRQLGVNEALLVANYVYQHPDPDNTLTRSLDHIGSVNLKLDSRRWGLRADLSAASGFSGQSNLLGVMVMPFFNITHALQVVTRYTSVTSDEVNGVRLATYESRIEEGRGDEYREFYVGANYYFYGHRLKLQSGLQVADMNDRAADGGEYSGTSWTTGIRVGW